MPNPSFEPIIGSSFDALAAQRAGWAGFNANIDSANIARLNAAEQTQNDWLRQVSALQQAAQNRDLTMAQEAEATRRAAVTRREDIAIAERARAQDLGLTKERIAAENRRTEKMGEIAQTNLALKQKQAEQAIETAGQTAANSYLIAKNNADAANHVYEKLQDDIKDIESQREGEMAKDAKKRDPVKLADYATKLKALTGQIRQAEVAKNRAENQFQSLGLHIQNKGFELDLDNNKVVHPPTGKSWSFKAALAQAKDNLLLPGMEADDGGDPTASEDWASAYGAGTTSGTGTTAPMVAAAIPASTGAARIRRYNPVTDSFE